MTLRYAICLQYQQFNFHKNNTALFFVYWYFDTRPDRRIIFVKAEGRFPLINKAAKVVTSIHHHPPHQGNGSFTKRKY